MPRALLLHVAMGLLMFQPSAAGAQEDSSSRVKVYVHPGRVNVAPGEDLPVAVILDHDRNWHTNTNDPQLPPGQEDLRDTLIPTTITAIATGGLSVHQQLIKWPRPTEVTLDWIDRKQPFGVFASRAIAYIPVTVNRNAAFGPATLSVSVRFQACDDESCLQPATKDFSVSVNIVPPSQADAADGLDPQIFGGFPHEIWSGIDRGPAASTEEGAATILYLVIGAVTAVVVLVVAARLFLRR